MKKKMPIILTALAALPLATVDANAAPNVGVVTASTLNVRSGPSTSYNVLFKLKKNDEVNILGNSNGWYKISSKSGKEGWVSGQYISLSTSSNQQSSTNATKMIVNVDGLNMRSGPSTAFRVNKVLNKGTEVEVVSEKDGWTQIKYSNMSGYVASRYLDAKKNSNTVEVPKENAEQNKTEKSVKKTVNVNDLNMRMGPSTRYKVISVLSKGTQVEVLSEKDGWSSIRYNNQNGHVASRYLNEIKPPDNTQKPSQPEVPNIDKPVVTVQKTVNVDGLNMRSGPSTTYKVVTVLSKGTNVEVLSEKDGWSSIRYNNQNGHVASRYLNEIKVPDNTQKPSQPEKPSSGGSYGSSNGVVEEKVLNYTLGEHLAKQVVLDQVIHSANVRSSITLTSFIRAVEDDIRYYLDPSNFTKTQNGMYQFLKLNSYREISEAKLNAYLNNLKFNSNQKNIFANKAKVFIDASKKYNVDAIYLVSHAMWETGYGTSRLAQGQTISSYKGQALSSPVVVYNFYGIGAIDKNANVYGAEAAYCNGWTSVDSAIYGAADWISKNYVNSSKYNQNTLYKMRWNYDVTWHRYATDVNWANGIGNIMNNISYMYNNANIVYEVPKYK